MACTVTPILSEKLIFCRLHKQRDRNFRRHLTFLPLVIKILWNRANSETRSAVIRLTNGPCHDSHILAFLYIPPHHLPASTLASRRRFRLTTIAAQPQSENTLISNLDPPAKKLAMGSSNATIAAQPVIAEVCNHEDVNFSIMFLAS